RVGAAPVPRSDLRRSASRDGHESDGGQEPPLTRAPSTARKPDAVYATELIHPHGQAPPAGLQRRECGLFAPSFLRSHFMRTAFRLLSVLFLATSPVLADDRDKALAVIDRAVQAHGGESALTKAQLMTRSATGEMTLFDKAVPFKDEMAAQLPDRLRSFVDVGEGDQKVLVLLVINGDKGWQSAGGAVMEL